MPKILIVDDEKKARSLYKRLLASETYEVLEADGCEAASQILMEESDVELVLLDINMPMLDGGVLYRLVRMLDSRIKVIVMSAYPLQDQKDRIVRADDYFDKSQGIGVLLEKVRAVLNAQEEPHAHT